MENKTVITLTNVRKQYRLGSYGRKTLHADVQSWWAKKTGKDDPNSKIGVKNVGARFYAVDGITLEIKKGEAVGIIGANGAGKSTLLKLISRITSPTEGEIDVVGRITSMLEVGTGFHPEMTGRENIYMNGAILGMTKQEIDGVIEKITDFSEIGEFIDTPVKRYSSGMLVKLAFSVAAHLQSEIMIMDEVLAVGDAAFRNKCLDELHRAASEEGRTVLYVSHNMSTIRRLCTRCIVLEKGKVIFDGDPEKAIEYYMKSGCLDGSTVIDAEHLAHNTDVDTPDIRIKKITLTGKETAQYLSGELLEIAVDTESREKSDGNILRATFRTDDDIAIGTSWSNEFSVSENADKITAKLPLTFVREGTFYISLGIYRKTENGSLCAIDHITHAVGITVDDKSHDPVSAYGYTVLPQMKAE